MSDGRDEDDEDEEDEDEEEKEEEKEEEGEEQEGWEEQKAGASEDSGREQMEAAQDGAQPSATTGLEHKIRCPSAGSYSSPLSPADLLARVLWKRVIHVPSALNLT